MSAAEFLSTLRERDVRLWVEDGRLKCEAPAGALDEALREQLVTRKQELINLIGAAGSTTAHTLVPLKASGDYPPIFARPGHNGDVFCYRPLAEHLDQRRPLYGVEPKGLDGSPPLETVEEMAQYEVRQIRAFQPEGPYVIAGYCAGGSIAFEAARQLEQAGAEVARLLLFAGPFPDAYRAGRVRTQVNWLRYRGKHHASRVAAGSFSDGVRYVGARASAGVARATRRPDPALANRRRVELATVAAVKRYEPGQFAGRIDIFLPNEAWRRSGDRPDDWKRVAGQVVEHVGPDDCDADAMLQEPYVVALADLLNPSLGDAKGA